MIRISVVDGAPAQTFEFAEDVVSVGRSSRNALVLEDKSLSRTHCEIASVNGRFILVNHARTNGTMVNGKPVGEAFLKPGDRILVGRVELRFEGSDEGGGGAESKPSKSGAKRKLFARAASGGMDPMLYGVAFAAGLAISPVIYLILR
jgi:pSer/pThr/pTyr-binding forkhead associated (FHA) protein